MSRVHVGTCQTCLSTVRVETAPSAGLKTPKLLTAPCVVCRWPMVLAEPTRPAVEHALVEGTEKWDALDREFGLDASAMRCACGMTAPRVAPGTFRCESHLPRRRVTVAPW